jgi:hypothetical protein
MFYDHDSQLPARPSKADFLMNPCGLRTTLSQENDEAVARPNCFVDLLRQWFPELPISFSNVARDTSQQCIVTRCIDNR